MSSLKPVLQCPRGGMQGVFSVLGGVLLLLFLRSRVRKFSGSLTTRNAVFKCLGMCKRTPVLLQVELEHARGDAHRGPRDAGRGAVLRRERHRAKSGRIYVPSPVQSISPERFFRLQEGQRGK